MVSEPSNIGIPTRPGPVKLVTWLLVLLGVVEAGGVLLLGRLAQGEINLPILLAGLVALAFHWVCAGGYWSGQKWSVLLYGIFCALVTVYSIMQGNLLPALIPFLILASMIAQWGKGSLNRGFAQGTPVKMNWKAIGAAGAVIAALGVIAAFMILNPLKNEPKKTFLLKSEVAANIEDLQVAAEILTQRAQNLGYQGAAFRVESDGQIVGSVPETMTMEELKGICQVGLLELVDLGDQYLAEGRPIRTDYQVASLPDGDGQAWHTILTSYDFASGKSEQGQLGDQVVWFTLKEQGRQVFADFTKASVGKYVAIVYDKKILSTPKIHSEITEGTGIIQGNFTLLEANTLAAILGTQPMPVRLEVIEP